MSIRKEAGTDEKAKVKFKSNTDKAVAMTGSHCE